MKKTYLTVAVLFLGLNVSAMDWELQNPLHQSNDLLTLQFVTPTIGFAAGAKGTILKTTDGGMSWVTLNSGITTEISTIFFTDEFTGYAAYYSGISKTVNGGKSWESLVCPALNEKQLRSLFFIDEFTGYVVYDDIGRVLKTTDGGVNWVRLNDKTYIGLKSICFIDTNTGFMVGYGSGIYKTIDAGATWISKMDGGVSFLSAICFPTSQIGYVVGEYDKIFKTTDGGESWSKSKAGINSSLCSVSFIDSVNGIAVGKYGTIVKTTNGGVSWEIKKSGTNKNLNSVVFKSATQCFAVGANGTIVQTNDGGNSWSIVNAVTDKNLNAVYFGSSTTGYAYGEEKTVVKTVDGGNTWSALAADSLIHYIQAVSYSTVDTGYALDVKYVKRGDNSIGKFSSILKTTDAGNGWKLQTGIDGELTALCLVNSTAGFAIGSEIVTENDPSSTGPLGTGVKDVQKALLLKTDDGGVSWKRQNSGDIAVITSICFTDLNTGYLLGYTLTDNEESPRSLRESIENQKKKTYMLQKTVDGGITWKTLTSGFNDPVTIVYFFNSTTGFIVGGQIHRTTDAGVTWKILQTNVSGTIHAICFTDTNTGYLAGSNGKILKTINGGLNWKTQAGSSVSLNALYAVSAGDVKNVYAVGDDGIILKYVQKTLKPSVDLDTWVSAKMAEILQGKNGQFDLLVNLVTLREEYQAYCSNHEILCNDQLIDTLTARISTASWIKWGENEYQKIAENIRLINQARALRNILPDLKSVAISEIDAMIPVAVKYQQNALVEKSDLPGDAFITAMLLKGIGKGSYPDVNKLKDDFLLNCIPVNLSFSTSCTELYNFISLPGKIQRKTVSYTVNDYVFKALYKKEYVGGSTGTQATAVYTQSSTNDGYDRFGNAYNSRVVTTKTIIPGSSGTIGQLDSSVTGYSSYVSGILGAPINQTLSLTEEQACGKIRSNYPLNREQVLHLLTTNFARSLFSKMPKSYKSDFSAAYRKLANSTNDLSVRRDALLVADIAGQDYYDVFPKSEALAEEIGIMSSKLTEFFSGKYSPGTGDLLTAAPVSLRIPETFVTQKTNAVVKGTTTRNNVKPVKLSTVNK